MVVALEELCFKVKSPNDDLSLLCSVARHHWATLIEVDGSTKPGACYLLCQYAEIEKRERKEKEEEERKERKEKEEEERRERKEKEEEERKEEVRVCKLWLAFCRAFESVSKDTTYQFVWKEAVKSSMPDEETFEVCLGYTTFRQWNQVFKDLPSIPPKTPPQPTRSDTGPGTPSNPSVEGFAKLMTRMAELRQPPSRRATIFCNSYEIRDGCSSETFISHLTECPVDLSFLGDVLESTGYSTLLPPVNLLMEGDGDLQFSQLVSKKTKEPQFQKVTRGYLATNCQDLVAQDTADSDSSPMCASLPVESEKNEQHHDWTNRIDFASRVFPCGLELKGSSAVGKSPHLSGLDQGLKRVQVLTQRAAHLKRVIVFVLAPPACTMIIAASSIENCVLEWTIHLVSIPVSHMFPLWRLFQEHAQENPSWYLHQQASCLRLVVQKIWDALPPVRQRELRGPKTQCREPSSILPLCYFSIQFVADCASSTVYLINSSTANPGERRIRLLRHGPQTLAVKVYKKQGDYLNEVNCLHKMAQKLVKRESESLPEWENPSRFYPLAHVDFQ